MPLHAELRAEALAAREAADPDRAVLAWRALLDLTPDDWSLALELKQDLRAGWHYPDSDQRFRRAARHLPDREWLAHYAQLYAFHGSDLDVIDSRARLLLATWPDDARLYAIIGDVARQRRDWPEAHRAFTAASRLDPARGQ
jgi:predicted Zn-dependent protease